MPTGNQVPEQQQSKQTVAQLFAAKGWAQWWNNDTNGFNVRPGANDCTQHGINLEFGTDFGIAFQTPIRAIAAGQVIYAQRPEYYYTPGHQSIGYVVQIRGGDGSIFHYQHLDSTPLRVGNQIVVGDIVGMSGGLPIDNSSTGPHIEVRFSPKEANGTQPWCNGNWINSLPIITAVVGGVPIGASATFPQGVSASLSGIYNKLQLANPLTPTSDVAIVFYDIDAALEITPILPSSDILNGISITNLSPIFMFGFDLTYNIMGNIGAFFLRGVIFLIGVYICFQVFNNVIHFTQRLGQGIEAGAGLARLGVVFA